VQVDPQPGIEALFECHRPDPRPRLPGRPRGPQVVAADRAQQDPPHALHTQGSYAPRNRTRYGSDSTHCRYGTSGSTRSTSHAAWSAMRRLPHDGQKPRPLHENATSSSFRHELQYMRARRQRRIPQRR
jgi:hypothetical protein